MNETEGGWGYAVKACLDPVEQSVGAPLARRFGIDG